MLKRLDWLDELRGFGIIWIVIGHAIERTISGMNYTNSPMHFFDVFANSIHIYILFMVSGYTYGIIERDKILEGNTKTFIIKKMLDLLLPYTYFGLLIWIGKSIFSQWVAKPVSIIDLISMYISPIAFAWYLYVLFIITIIVFFIDKLTKGNNIVQLIISILFILIQEIFDPTNITIHKVLHNTLFFVTGMILSRNLSYITGFYKLVICGLIFSVLTIVHYHYDNVWVILDAATHLGGALFFLMLFYRMRNLSNKLLIQIGKYTIYIYLLHPIILNSIKAIYLKTDITNILFWLVSMIFLGILIPYQYGILANKYKLLELLFRPRKYILKK